MKYIQQLDETDCAAACIAMIASVYGIQKTVTSIREIASTDKNGTNLLGIVKASKKIGLKARALKGDKTSLSENLPFPFIAHLAIKIDDMVLLHYCIVTKISKNKVYITDPDESKRRYELSIDEFCEKWTGYVIFFSLDKNTHIEKKNKSFFSKFLPVVLPQIKVLVMAGVASVLLIVFGIISSFYFRYIIDEVIFSQAKVTLTTVSIGMVCIVIFQGIMTAIRSILLTHFSFKIDLSIVFSYFAHVFHLPLSFFDTRKTGEILSRLEDVSKIRNALSQTVLSVVMDSLMILVIGPILFAQSKILFCVLLLTVPFSSVVMIIFSKLYKKQYKEVMCNAAEVQSYLVESVNGSSTIKAMNAESIVFSEYEKRHMKMTWSGWKAARLQIYQFMSTDLIKQIGSSVLFWIGSYYIIKGEFSLGTLISFNALAGYFTGPLERLVNVQSSLQEAYVAADRLGEILELDLEQDEQCNLLKPEHFYGDIEVKNLSFQYGTRRPIYKDLSLTINAGECVAFVGSSGCGKTTLAKLLLKFYLPQNGIISIDGIDIRDIDAFYLRKKIGYVPQEIFLFSGTIAENIALHKPEASIEEIVEVAKRTGAHDFISKLPERYNTQLGERGATLSGGERQRLALSRALLGNPEILILDEATSNLDTVSEKQIHKTIESIKQEKITVIIIAHRLSTIISCDRIFVMSEGVIVEQGTHNELAIQNGIYQDLWQGVLV